jgi:hypothetical protein
MIEQKRSNGPEPEEDAVRKGQEKLEWVKPY